MRRAAYVLIAIAAGCAHGAGRACPAGDVAIRTQHDVDAIAGCRAIAGGLAIKTAAPIDLRGLGSLEEIGGALEIGPTIALSTIDGFAHLKTIAGPLRIAANAEVTGAYFPALEAAGAVTIDGNLSLAELFAPKLARVAGDVLVAHNGALEIVDLGALVVAGHITFDDNRQLGEVHVPALGSAAPPP